MITKLVCPPSAEVRPDPRSDGRRPHGRSLARGGLSAGPSGPRPLRRWPSIQAQPNARAALEHAVLLQVFSAAHASGDGDAFLHSVEGAHGTNAKRATDRLKRQDQRTGSTYEPEVDAALQWLSQLAEQRKQAEVLDEGGSLVVPPGALRATTPSASCPADEVLDVLAGHPSLWRSSRSARAPRLTLWRASAPSSWYSSWDFSYLPFWSSRPFDGQVSLTTTQVGQLLTAASTVTAALLYTLHKVGSLIALSWRIRHDRPSVPHS